MKLIRNETQETVSLEDGFLWPDEFAWSPIQQSTEYALDGALIIQEGFKQAGRPITLQPADTGMGWIKLRELRTLRAWSLLSEQFTLKFEWPHDQREFNVVFNHEKGALTAVPIKNIPAVSLDDYYNVTIQLLEVESQ